MIAGHAQIRPDHRSTVATQALAFVTHLSLPSTSPGNIHRNLFYANNEYVPTVLASFRHVEVFSAIDGLDAS